jgi:DNA-binding LytR/AlgR family response regulator
MSIKSEVLAKNNSEFRRFSIVILQNYGTNLGARRVIDEWELTRLNKPGINRCGSELSLVRLSLRGCSNGGKKLVRRILIKCDGKVFFVREQDIVFVEAAGHYAYVSLGSVTLFTKTSLARLESRLNKERFVRLHRSAIVNLDQIGHLEPQGTEYLLTLKGGKQLKASRKHVSQLLKTLRVGSTEDNVA